MKKETKELDLVLLELIAAVPFSSSKAKFKWIATVPLIPPITDTLTVSVRPFIKMYTQNAQAKCLTCDVSGVALLSVPAGVVFVLQRVEHLLADPSVRFYIIKSLLEVSRVAHVVALWIRTVHDVLGADLCQDSGLAIELAFYRANLKIIVIFLLILLRVRYLNVKCGKLRGGGRRKYLRFEGGK